jgi:iron complex outermembrane recepter protein
VSRTLLKSIAVGACVMLQTQAWGQQAAPAGPAQEAEPALAEVIVTAQRRSENLQDVPIAVTALSADQLALSGIVSTTELGEVVPGLTVVNQNGDILPHIRGVGTTLFGAGIENSVATYVDGVYIASQAGSFLTLNNIAQLEVLKGPQGTLFGRNATGGLIQITTKDPQSTFSGDASLSYGNYQTSVGQLYVTGPVVGDKLAADLAVSATTQGQGYGTNQYNGQEVYKTDHDIAARSKWLFTPSDATTVRLIGDYEDIAGSQYSTRGIAPGTKAPFGAGAGPAVPTYDVDENFQPYNSFKGGGVSLRVDQRLGFAQLSSISAYRGSKYLDAFDGDASPVSLQNIIVGLDDTQLTQEFQLTSVQSGPLQWVLGAFYLHDDSSYDPSTVEFGGPLVLPAPEGAGLPASVSTYGEEKTGSESLYGQSTLAITTVDHLTLGFRYTEEKRQLIATQVAELANGFTVYPLAPPHASPFLPPPALTPSKTFTAPTWRFSYDHRFSDEVLGYLSYNRGFKSGGFNAGDPTQPAFEPETLDAYEIGLKTDLWDRRLRLDTAAYYYHYKDIQVANFLAGSIAYYNGAVAEIYGIDADLKALVTEKLTLTAGVSYIHDRYTNFPDAQFYIPNPVLGGNTISTQSADGNRLPLTPDETFNLSGDYRYPLPAGSLGLNVTYLYSTRYVFSPDNILYQPAYNLVNAAISWTAPGDRFTASLWGKNLSNTFVADGLLSSTFGSLSNYAPPRTYGVKLEVKF